MWPRLGEGVGVDTVTQAVFGAVVAQAGFRRRLGRGALAWGAAAGVLPDLDSVAGLAGTLSEWVHHRGVTHSVFFGPVVGPLLGWAVWAWHRHRGAPLGAPERRPDWMWLFLVVLLTHPLIDLFTHYGTQLLAPFSRHRFAIPAMPIIDPLYSGVLLAALAVGAFARRRALLAARTAAAALLLIWVYSLTGWALAERTAAAARLELAQDGVGVRRLDAFPTLLQPYWRRVVAHADDGRVLIGFRSALDPGRGAGEWHVVRSDLEAVVARVAATPEARILSWFASGNVLWRLEADADGAARVVGYDIRYGLPGGTVLGLWGVEAMVEGEGFTPPRPFERSPEDPAAAFAAMWTTVFGG